LTLGTPSTNLAILISAEKEKEFFSMVNESFKESREDSNIEILSQIIKVFTEGVNSIKNGKI